MNPQQAFDELCGYTLALRDPSFIHQHVVDAFAAQSADEHTKPIKLTFALVGLHLHVEKNFSGRKVQLVHMRLAKKKQSWPRFPLPRDRGRVSVCDVLAVPEGPARTRVIDEWCVSVWEAFRESHHAIAELLRERGVA